MAPTARDATRITFRRPVEADHPRMVAVVDDWWGGRHLRALLPRLWLQHFTGTSWVAEHPDGRLAGFLVGFHSPDRAEIAYCHMIAVDPNLRKVGVGRALYERFFTDARAAGRTRAVAITWPGNRLSVAFHMAIGFRPSVGPNTQPLYGTPAYPDYDDAGEDRVVFSLEL
jgi:GNAT superfamily N-acetyltransferase